MPDSKLTRYLSMAQAAILRRNLEHGIAMARAELEAIPGVDPRGIDHELGMCLARLAANHGLDLTQSAEVARLEAEIERMRITAPLLFASESDPVRFADGTHQGNGKGNGNGHARPIDPYVAAVERNSRELTALREGGQAPHPRGCRCGPCLGKG